MTNLALVTGATGFIGFHLVQALIEKGTAVRCLVRQTSDTSRLPVDQVELVQGDILDPPSLEQALLGVGTVYHLAANIDASKRKSLYKVNIEGTRNVAAACASQPNPPVLMYLSSQEAGGPDFNGVPRTELHEPAPVTHYGETKLQAEVAAAEFANRVPMTFVRASVVFGEYDTETLAVFKAFRIGGVGLYPLPGANTVKLSIIHARDLAGFLMLAAEHGERCLSNSASDTGEGVYYSAYGLHPTFGELIKIAAQALGDERIQIIEIPMGVVWLVAGLSELWSQLRGGAPGIINLDKARGVGAGSWTCSPEKSIQLGFSPQYSLTQRIQQTVTWYREHGWL